MKLIVSVVNRDDVYTLSDELVRAGHTATIISTTGGFLREGNATLLIGVKDSLVQQVLEIIRETCHERTVLVNTVPPLIEYEEALAYAPIEVEVGGAVVFILNVERFVKF
jgi:uncharacterized protein YaaQ